MDQTKRINFLIIKGLLNDLNKEGLLKDEEYTKIKHKLAEKYGINVNSLLLD